MYKYERHIYSTLINEIFPNYLCVQCISDEQSDEGIPFSPWAVSSLDFSPNSEQSEYNKIYYLMSINGQ